MNETIVELIEKISAAMPELQLVDEDYGQIETPPSDQYPVVFPCVLLSSISADWDSLTAAPTPVQIGTAEITVRLAIDCYDDTHAGSGTTDRIAERARMNRRLVSLLHGYRPAEAVSAMRRIRSTATTTQYNWKIYETTFQWKTKDNTATRL